MAKRPRYSVETVGVPSSRITLTCERAGAKTSVTRPSMAERTIRSISSTAFKSRSSSHRPPLPSDRTSSDEPNSAQLTWHAPAFCGTSRVTSTDALGMDSLSMTTASPKSSVTAWASRESRAATSSSVGGRSDRSGGATEPSCPKRGRPVLQATGSRRLSPIHQDRSRQ